MIPDAWVVRNCRQVGDARRGAGPSPAAARIRRIVPSPPGAPGQAAHPEYAGSPARVLPRQLLHQCAHLGPGPAAVPACPSSHDPVQPQVPGQQPCQGREDGTVSPVRPRARDLPAQHSDLVPQHQDLRVFGGVTARQQRQPAEHPDHEQVDEADEHEHGA
jgi:hypothetical protein